MKYTLSVIVALFAVAGLVQAQEAQTTSIQLNSTTTSGDSAVITNIKAESSSDTGNRTSDGADGDKEDDSSRDTQTGDTHMEITSQTSAGIEPDEIDSPKVEGEDSASFGVEREMKESGEKGGTADINIGVGEMRGDGHKDWIIIESASGGARMNKAELIDSIAKDSNGGLRSGYIKIGDIKGESTDKASDGDDSSSSSKKPKEIVVVGSKVRGENVTRISSKTGDAEARVDSFFDIWVEAADAEEAARADSFFDIWVDAGEDRSAPDSFFDIFVDVSDEDLHLQAVHFAQSHDEVEEVNLGERDVRVEYRDSVKLFGLIPLQARRTIIVDANSETDRVKVKYPWWHIFATGKVDAKTLDSEIEAGLQQDIPWSTSGDADDRPTEEVAFYYNKIQAQALLTISNTSK